MKSPEIEPSLPQKTHAALPGVGKASLTLALLFAGTTKAQHPVEPQPVGVNGVAVPGTVQFPTRVFAQDPVAPFIIPPLPERNPIAEPKKRGVGPFGIRFPIDTSLKMPKIVSAPPAPKAKEHVNAQGQYIVEFLTLDQCDVYYDRIRRWHDIHGDDECQLLLLYVMTNNTQELEKVLHPSSGTDDRWHIPIYRFIRENPYTRGFIMQEASTHLHHATAFELPIALADMGLDDPHYFVQLQAALLVQAMIEEVQPKENEPTRLVPEDMRRGMEALKPKADAVLHDIDRRSIVVGDTSAFDQASAPMRMLRHFGPHQPDLRRRLRNTLARELLFDTCPAFALQRFALNESSVPEIVQLLESEGNETCENIRTALRGVIEKDPSLERRIAAAMLLLRTAEGCEEAVTRFLIDELKQATPDDEVRRVTAGFFVEELGENVDFGTRQIVKSLDAEEDHVRGIALEALGNLRDSQQAKVIMLWLERSLRDKNFRVRDEAARSLQKLGSRFPEHRIENFDASLDRYKKEREAEVARIKAERATKGR